MKFLKLLMPAVCLLLYSRTNAQDSNVPMAVSDSQCARVCAGFCNCDGNSQAPLGVMTDHIHGKGQWMLTYTYMNTMMQGARTATPGPGDNYMMQPESMTMQMHMLMAMYGVTDRFTLMAMGGYTVSNMSMTMDMTTAMPGMVMPLGSNTMLTNSSGITDSKVFALYNFSNKATQRIIGSLGINLPTGSIHATGTTMLGDGQRLPYDMQPGTGSFSICPDVTFVHKHNSVYWGANAGADVKLNYNSLGYKDGNTYHGSAWAGYQFFPFLSATVRGEGVHMDKISGSDPVIDNAIYQYNDPTTRTADYGGTWMNMYIGLNFYLMKPVIQHFRFLAEYGMPVYQSLYGTQLALHSNVYAGIQYMF